MNNVDWAATATLPPKADIMSPPLSAEANGKRPADGKSTQESPLKRVQVPSKRKEMDQGLVDLTSISSPPARGSSPVSTKRPKTSKNTSSDTREGLINGTFVKLDLQKKTLTLNQEPQPLDKHTSYLSLMAQFQEWLLDQPLDKEVKQIPVEYWPLVVMVGHEYSATGKSKLVDHVGSSLIPSEIAAGESAKISQAAISAVCTEVFTQVSYGFHPSDFASLTASSSNSPITTAASQPIKIPAALALRRWEAKELEMVPQSTAGRGFKARDVMKDRRRFRHQAREEVQKIAQTLDLAAMKQLFGLEKVDAVKSNVAIKEKKAGSEPSSVENPGTEASDASTVVKPVKAAKPKLELTPEQLAEKEVKDTERKAREADRQKKVEAQNKKAQEVAKSKALMQSFFKKPAAVLVAKKVQKPISTKAPVRCDADDIKVLARSDFEAHFKPFFAKSSVDIAPINRFSAHGNKETDDASEPAVDVSTWQPKDLLNDCIRRAAEKRPFQPRGGRPSVIRKRSIIEESRSGLVRKPKTEPPFCSIPDLVDRAQEAEDPRLVYSHLNDLTKFPRKTFKFDEDLRPPYSGTWTKPSWFVGPRTPFALDPNLDYAMDEGLDWEPENLDEGAMDVDEEEEPESEDDDDLGSWLASDDEFEEPAAAVSLFNDPFATEQTLGMPNVKPRVNKEQKLLPRKFETLIPFSKGPVWEDGLGEVAWKGFEQYKICVLNDAPLGGIDPFTWQALEAPKVQVAQTANPVPVIQQTTDVSSAPPPASVTPAKILTPRPIPQAKFSQAELGEFLRAINGSDKTSRALVVDLSGRFKSAGTQASIKAKIDEVASKAPVKGAVWSVKPAAWVEAGISFQNHVA